MNLLQRPVKTQIIWPHSRTTDYKQVVIQACCFSTVVTTWYDWIIVMPSSETALSLNTLLKWFCKMNILFIDLFSFGSSVVSAGVSAVSRSPTRPQFNCPRCCASILNQTNQDRIPSRYISSHWLSLPWARYQCDISADCWSWPQGLVSHTEEQNAGEWLRESIHPFSKLLMLMTARTQT